MRNLKITFLTIIALAFNININAQYCASTSSNGGYEHISNVAMGSINNSSNSANYEDYTALSAYMTLGESYSITITNGNGYAADNCTVWIDWNQDNDFIDADEEFIIGTGSGPTYTSTIVTPVGALLGSTRMRVQIQENGTPAPCDNFTYGEVEDYTINVISNSDMEYVSATTTQTNTSNAIISSTNNEVIGINIVVSGGAAPFDVSSFSFNTSGTTNPSTDIINAKLWSTGNSNVFSTDVQIGATTSLPDGAFTISATHTLISDTNFFWLSYDVGTTEGNFIDAQCDSIMINDTLRIPAITNPTGNREISKFTAPFAEDFEHGGSIPSFWTQEYIDYTNDWTFQNGSGYEGPENAHSGDYNAFFPTSSSVYITKLITPSIDLSSSSLPFLTFWHAQAMWGTDGPDNLNVYFKTTESGSWVSLQQFTTTTSTWTQRSIYLPNKSSTYYIAFEGVSYWGSGVCVDDVYIYDAASDLSVIEWTTPQSECNLSASENITVKVVNYGYSSATNSPVSYSIDGGISFIIDTITETIAPQDTVSFTFAVPADFSAYETYNCIVATSLIDDGSILNDSLFIDITNVSPISSFPFYEDFESNTSAFFNLYSETDANIIINYDGVNNHDLRFTGRSSGDWYGGEGSVTSTDAWTNNVSHHASPFTCTVDASALSELELLLDIKQQTYAVWLDYSWFRVLINGVQISDIEGNSSFNPLIQIEEQFRTLKFDLTAYAGTSFILTLQSSCKYNEYYSPDGIADFVFIDNIKLREPIPGDAELVSLISPIYNSCGLSDAEEITVSITNLGFEAISNFNVSYTINGTNLVTDSIFTDTIQPGDTLNYTFSQLADLSANGNITIGAWTELAGDGDNTNDSIFTTIIHWNGISSFPFVEDFETGSSDYFYMQTSEQSTAAIINDEGSFVLSMHGGTEVLEWTGSCDAVTPNNAWNENLLYHASAMTCNVDASSASLELIIDIKQNYSYCTDFSWFRVLINGVQIADTNGFFNFNPIMPNDPYSILKFDLSAYSGTQFTLTLQTCNKLEDDIVFIDNIRLNRIIEDDIGIVTIISPVSGCQLSNAENITVQIENFGLQTVSNFDVVYQIDGGTIVVESLTNTINAGETFDYTFPQTLDLSNSGTYLIKTWVVLTGDEMNNNDTIIEYIFNNHDINIDDYTMNFEIDDDFDYWWNIENSNADDKTWEIMSFNGINNSQCARYTSHSINNADDWLLSKCVYLNSGEPYNVSFFYKAEDIQGEKLRLCYGTAQDPATMIDTLIELDNIVNTNYESASKGFYVPSDGVYYFGWQAYSDADQWNLYIDSIVISKYQLAVDIGDDIYICQNDSLLLDANVPLTTCTYLWSTGATTSSIMVDYSDLAGSSIDYWLFVTNTSNSETISDTVTVYAHPEFNINLGSDTTIFDDFISLNAGNGFSNYLWSDNSTNQTLYVDSTGTYSVVVTDNNACLASDTISISIIVGNDLFDDNSLLNVHLYPNPSKGIVNILINGKTNSELLIEVLNVQGEIVYNEKINNILGEYNESIDFSDFAKGVYFFKINANDKIQVAKLIIQ